MKLTTPKTELSPSVQLSKVFSGGLRFFLRTTSSQMMAMIGVMALLFGPGLSAVRAQNLLLNPGFETGTLTNWNESTNGAFGVYSFPTPVHGGTYQAFIQSSAGSSPNYAFIYQDVAGSPGQTYIASVWARDYAAYPETMQLSMEFYDVNTNYLSESSVPQAINTTYTQLTASAVAPAGTALVRTVLLVYNGTGATGVANFDDASVTVMTAPNITYTRPTGVSAQYYSIASLLTNVTGVVPGQTITLVGLGGSSQGATITTNGGYIVYTPTDSGTNLDSFTYTVADGLGDTATGTIFVNATLQAQNLLINPGFETGDLTGWSDDTINFFGVYNFPSPVYDGTYQAFIESYASSPYYAYMYQDVAGSAGQTYTASVWGRDYAAFAETMQLAMEFHDVNGYYISQAPVQQTINTTYTQMLTSAVAPAGTAKIRIVLLVYSASGATGAANFDDASVSGMTALNVAYTRPPGTGIMNITIANLLTNVIGVAPGQTISLTSLGSSTQGATITTGGGYIQYSPANNSTNLDYFTYTVTDGLGGTATGTIFVSVVPATGKNSGAITVSTGVAKLPTVTFAGIPGYMYVVQRATNLTPPIAWVNISTNTAPASGLMTNTDGFAGLSIPPYPTSAFYRMQFLQNQ